MLKRLIGALVVFTAFTSVALCGKGLRLELEADDCFNKIWANIPMSEAYVKDKLHFNVDSQSNVYNGIAASFFYDLYNKAIKDVPEDRFIAFANTCKNVFDKSDDKHKLELSVLFKEVTDKSFRYWKNLERVKAFNQENSYPKVSENVDSENLINLFINADKRMRAH